MKQYIDVTTQAQVDEALKSGDFPRIRGGGYFAVRSGYVEAYDSSNVTAYGSSNVRAYDSSNVTAYDSSNVTAYDSSNVTAYGSSNVTATKFVPVQVHGKLVKTKGGVIVRVPEIKTPEDWCEYYGVDSKRGKIVLYKALNADFSSPKKGDYTPGKLVECDRWDPKIECGAGLHFSPRPFMALAFHNEAKKFVACEVLLKDVVIHPDGSYPEKCKAPKCKALYECDIDGNKI